MRVCWWAQQYDINAYPLILNTISYLYIAANESQRKQNEWILCFAKTVTQQNRMQNLHKNPHPGFYLGVYFICLSHCNIVLVWQ